MPTPSEGWEPLEHTADVGVRAWAPDMPGLFEWAARGLLETIGVWGRAGEATELEVAAAGRDSAGVLVDWLAEILYLQDSQDLTIERVVVDQLDGSSVLGRLTAGPRTTAHDGIQVKAVTYHRMKVEQTDIGFLAEVYLDV